MRLPISRHGWPQILRWTLPLWVLAAAAVALSTWGLAIPLALLGLAVLLFFRDPQRQAPEGEHHLVAPADGRVKDIEEVAEAPFIEGPATRIGIFLSLFDVHINRAPCAGRVEWIAYQSGRFHPAYAPTAATENESNTVGLVLPDGKHRVLVKQIAGVLARRIVCDCVRGQELRRGQRFGMIKFGSRTELYLPKGLPCDVKVKVGDRVFAGRTVIGTIHREPPAAEKSN